MRCEVLTDPEMYEPGKAMLAAMIATSPISIVRRDVYKGDCELLMSYGLGHIGRRFWVNSHLDKGGRLIGFDLGYWNRGSTKTIDRPLRLTIDQDHPQEWIDDCPPERFDTAGVDLLDLYSPAGPIVIVGLGAKTNRALGQPMVTWERTALSRIREVYSETEVIYRPKREDGTILPGTRRMVGMPIEHVLRGASLVVCRHSNVAIDAAIAGVPVVCEDGIAAALYNNDLRHPVIPTHAERLRFLRAVAWWQWRPSEAKQCWEFVMAQLERSEHEVTSRDLDAGPRAASDRLDECARW